MKKIMTLCFFAFAMILGTQTIAAQSKVEVNTAAATKTQELKKALKLNKDVEARVYTIFQEHITAKASLDQMKTSDESMFKDNLKKYQTFLVDKFKLIFTEDQMERYLVYAKTHN